MRKLALVVVILVTGAFITSCKTKTGILYTIFSISYKTYKPLEVKKELIDSSLLGGYIASSQRALLIESKDSVTFYLRFLPVNLNESTKLLEAFITTLNGKKYLNVFTDDDNYLFFRIDNNADSSEFKLLTNEADKYTNGTELSEWLKKDGNFPDTSGALFKIPLQKTSTNEAMQFCKNQLRPQVGDLASYKLYEQIFPEDEKAADLKEKAMNISLNRTSSVTRIYKIGQEYPFAAERAKMRAKEVCYSTANCLDFLSLYPNDILKDTLVPKAFRFAASENDYRLLIKNFPENKKITQVMTRLYFSERKRCKTAQDLKNLHDRYSNDKLFSQVMEAIEIFDRIPYEKIKFNPLSYALTQESKAFLDKILFSVSEVNKERQLIHDVYIAVNSNLVPSHYDNADNINFHNSVNRCISIRNYISASGIKSANFHFIPCGTGAVADSLSDGKVTFTLNEKQADEYKARFVKLCIVKKGIIFPDASRELALTTYLREEYLENYCLEVILEKLKENKHAEFKIIPCNFLMEEFKKDVPEFNAIILHFLTEFEANRIRKRTPLEFMHELK